MNDEPYFTRDDIERLKSRDARWADVETAIKIDEELRDSLALNLVLEAAKRDADAALEELAVANPADTPSIINLQARVYCARFIAKTLDAVRRRGLAAQDSLEQEGRIEMSEE